jgi:hypothetical protein
MDLILMVDASDLVIINKWSIAITFVYVDATKGWKVVTDSNR